MGLVAAAVRASEDVELIVEQETLVAWPPYVYGLIAISLLLVLLLIVTRLDLDR